MSADRLYISWERFENDCRTLAHKLLKHEFDVIIAITRGGLVPATYLARFLGIKHIDTVCLASYSDETDQQSGIREIKTVSVADFADKKVLVVDDLVDSGETFMHLKKMLPTAHRACVYAKPDGKPSAQTFGVSINQGTWIEFPWEVELDS